MQLYHFWLSPFCRKVRIVLREKQLDYVDHLERYWERREAFLAISPAGQVPALVLEDGRALADSQAIAEYLDETVPAPPLLGGSAIARAETRRVCAWFDDKFFHEVTRHLLGEKLLKRFTGGGEPSSERIRAGHRNLTTHLRYVSYLAERRNWLAGEDFGLADIAAASQLSCLDYLGDVPWDQFPAAKDWYARVKSRPSFRSILADHVAGLPPPKHYADLDF
ncbi:MAG: glutathione S-transferase family protein [Alphaproteobacteria bacterium]